MASALVCEQPHDVWTLSLESTNVEGNGVGEFEDFAWPVNLELDSYSGTQLSGEGHSWSLEKVEP